MTDGRAAGLTSRYSLQARIDVQRSKGG